MHGAIKHKYNLTREATDQEAYVWTSRSLPSFEICLGLSLDRCGVWLSLACVQHVGSAHVGLVVSIVSDDSLYSYGASRSPSLTSFTSISRLSFAVGLSNLATRLSQQGKSLLSTERTLRYNIFVGGKVAQGN